MFLKKVLVSVSLLAFLLLTLNNTLYFHVHLLSDGSIIEHAHPFNKHHESSKPCASHEHSSIEFIFLTGVFQASQIMLFFILLCLVLYKNSQQLFKHDIIHLICCKYDLENLLRGPPKVKLVY
jgi:hypothetical protein